MDRYASPVMLGLCTLVPLALLLGAVALFVLLPILKAPKAETIARATRKYLKEHTDVTRPEVEAYLRKRFVPDERVDAPVEDPGAGATFVLFGFIGLGIRGLIHMLSDMRASLTTMAVESRISKVLDTLGLDRKPRRRSRGRGY